jgi:hypothetical protein
MRFFLLRRRAKSRAVKILPVTYCRPRITSQIVANMMIPIDQGGGGTPSNKKVNSHFPKAGKELEPVPERHSRSRYFCNRNLASSAYALRNQGRSRRLRYPGMVGLLSRIF